MDSDKKLAPCNERLEEYLNKKKVAWMRSQTPTETLYGCFDVHCNSDGRFLTISTNKDKTLNIRRWQPGGYHEFRQNLHERVELKQADYGQLLACLRWLGYSL